MRERASERAGATGRQETRRRRGGARGQAERGVLSSRPALGEAEREGGPCSVSLSPHLVHSAAGQVQHPQQQLQLHGRREAVEAKADVVDDRRRQQRGDTGGRPQFVRGAQFVVQPQASVALPHRRHLGSEREKRGTLGGHFMKTPKEGGGEGGPGPLWGRLFVRNTIWCRPRLGQKRDAPSGPGGEQ